MSETHSPEVTQDNTESSAKMQAAGEEVSIESWCVSYIISNEGAEGANTIGKMFQTNNHREELFLKAIKIIKESTSKCNSCEEKDAELEHLKNECHKNSTKLKEQERVIDELRKSLSAQLETEKNHLQKIEELKKDTEDKDRRISSHLQTEASLKFDIKDKDDEITLYKQREEQSKTELASVSSANSQLKDDLQEANKRLQASIDEEERLARENQSNIDLSSKLAAEKGELEHELKSLQAQNSTLQSQRDAAEEQLELFKPLRSVQQLFDTIRDEPDLWRIIRADRPDNEVDLAVFLVRLANPNILTNLAKALNILAQRGLHSPKLIGLLDLAVNAVNNGQASTYYQVYSPKPGDPFDSAQMDTASVPAGRVVKSCASPGIRKESNVIAKAAVLT